MRLLLIVAAFRALTLINSSPTVISDGRIRSLDIAPVLGRGYSIATNTFQSTCLDIESTSEPSYNYDYYYTDLTSSDSSESALSGKISGSFGYWGVKAAVSASASTTRKSTTEIHHVVATMRIERFYSSVLEDKAKLSKDAEHLLQSKDFIGFFKACGPNYIRSIRRAQEVTAIFSFESTDTSSAREFASSLRVSGYGNSVSGSWASDSRQESIRKSLSIKITGYGLGLTKEGSKTLVATSLEEFNDVMKFAFTSMTTKDENDDGRGDTGMIYGMEVVPWTDNTSFQVKAQLNDESISLPLPRNLITKVDEMTGDCGYGLAADDFKQCCETDQMENSSQEDTTKQAEADSKEKVYKQICKPNRILPPSQMKFTLATNGEFVAQLDSALRTKLNTLFEFQRCLLALHAFPERFNYHYLKSADSVKYDEVFEMSVTVSELKMALDPFNDFSSLRMLSQELDEFVAMYFDPCTMALNGMNIGNDKTTDPKYLMAIPWFNHPECLHVGCLVENMVWDREKGGCVPSLLARKGTDDKDYKGNKDKANCMKYGPDDPNPERANKCKYEEDQLYYHENRKGCSGTKATAAASLYFMDLFCLPQLASEGVASGENLKRIEDAEKGCKEKVDQKKKKEDGKVVPSTI